MDRFAGKCRRIPLLVCVVLSLVLGVGLVGNIQLAEAQDLAADIEAGLPEGVTMETATPEELASAVGAAAADIAAGVAAEVPDAADEIADATGQPPPDVSTADADPDPIPDEEINENQQTGGEVPTELDTLTAEESVSGTGG